MNTVNDTATRRQSLRVLLVEALARADDCDPLVAIHVATAIDALDRSSDRAD